MPRKSNKVLVNEYLAYQRQHRGRSSTTVYKYACSFRDLTQHLGVTHFSQATTDDLRGFVVKPLVKGRRGVGAEPSAATRKRRVAELRGLFRWLHDEGYIGTNPAARLDAPAVHNENPNPFPTEDWRVLWASDLSDSDRVALGLAMFCGLRRHEVTLLSSANFASRQGAPWLVNFKRKGGVKRNLPWASCVTFFAERRPELLGGDANTFLAPLERLRRERDRAVALLDWQDSMNTTHRWVRHAMPEGFIDPQTFGRRLGRAMTAAGLPTVGRSPHMLRHAFCTNLLNAGVPLLDVSRLAGHSSVAITQRYLKTSEDPLAAMLGGTEDSGEEVELRGMWAS